VILALRPASAQPPAAPTGGDARTADAFCWRGRPLARCRAFLLVELSAPRHLAGTRIDPGVAEHGSGHPRWDQALASQFTYDIGMMVNVGERSAVGGTLTAGIAGEDPGRELVVGATGRYRRWLGPVMAADVGAGVLRMPVGIARQNPYGPGILRVSVHRPAVMAEARLGVGDLIAVSGRAMLATDGRGRTHRAVFGGASVGSTLTATVTALSAAIVTYQYLTAYRGDVAAASR
jgi:hypothetical protein